MQDRAGSLKQSPSSDVGYWNSFYRGARIATWPSQFAAFVLGEIRDGGCVVDFGCGSGRDSIFFAPQGRSVVGIDSSTEAIRNCTSIAAENGFSATFLCSTIDSADLFDQIVELTGDVETRTLYARFFLHAIDVEAENAFFRLAERLAKAGDILAVEFRTLRDSAQPKVTPDHFRRFIEPMSVVEKAHRHGFSSTYYVEGFGMAKFRHDDAYVVRCIFTKS